jgi:hypothetical protein
MWKGEEWIKHKSEPVTMGKRNTNLDYADYHVLLVETK